MIKIYILVLIVIVFCIYLNSAPKKKEHFYSQTSRKRDRARKGCHIIEQGNVDKTIANGVYELNSDWELPAGDYYGYNSTSFGNFNGTIKKS